MNQPIDLSRLGPAAVTTNSDAAKVSAWLAKVDEAGVRNYLELSRKLPILLLIVKAGDQAIETYAKALEGAIKASGGRIAGCELDAEASPSLTQALRVTSLPALFLLLDGKPSPVADSVVPAHELAELLRQILTLATQEGFTGHVTVSDEASAPPVDSRFDQAAQLVAEGKLAESALVFQDILKERPGDRDAKAGLGQVLLLQRLAQPTALSEQERELLPADQLFAAGDFAAALELLLDNFASAPQDSRQHIRERLIEFFGMIGDGEAVVISARSRLASMLF